MPPITAVPMIWRATEPAPDAVQSGTQPRIKASAVIMRGRKRSLAAESAASTRDMPRFFIVFLCKCDDQNRVFRRQADEHYQADLGVDIVLNLNHVRRQKETEHDSTQPQRS